ncbi:MAG: formate/nitrite transporter family protein [Alphaproteobacteria bacterium]|nr:formate/nitrite transporter family protein [Alphaproteobacteria bacterium]
MNPRDEAEPKSNARSIDPLLPAEMAVKAEQIGAAKARLDTLSLLALALLAGADIAFGAIFMTTTIAGAAGELPFGVTRMLGGLVFSLGLILVVVGGAELFTGNNLMVMAWAGRMISVGALLRAWVWVYIGNFVGAVGTAVMLFLSGHYKMAGGVVGRTALEIAEAKGSLPFVEALFLGILCNVLVCLAVWLTYSCRTVTGKVLVIVPPIAAFVAAGFEHSIANMFFLPYGILIQNFAGLEFWEMIACDQSCYLYVNSVDAIMNLIPVTVGNVIGGGVFVGIVYWFVYLRKR